VERLNRKEKTMDNIQYLKDLAAAEKRNKQTELEQAKAEALSKLDLQETTAKKTATTKRQEADTSSQIGAKNFAEYLANRGLTNAGIAAEAEMSRNNVLNRDINTINKDSRIILF
jgi:hypothetical protein